MVSTERYNHALLSGEAHARGIINSFIEDYSNYIRGAGSLAGIAYRIAKASHATSCTWECTEEECEIAGNRAFEDVKRYIEFAEMYIESEQ